MFWGLLLGSAVAADQGVKPNGTVELDGKATPVHWDDGDTFTIVGAGKSARLAGYNTLESYGPVHRFGPGATRLVTNADNATEVAKSSKWKCTTLSGSGGYGRIQVDCPGLRDSLLSAGLAHLFSVDKEARTASVQAQAEAIEHRRGMWSEGAPEFVITSVHSLDEKPGAKETYNRVVSTVTGQSEKRMHSNVYKTCTWVCDGGSCLLYVPYRNRYGEEKAECLN